MARYRKIDVRIWNDRKFRELSDNAKLAFLLVLTHPDTTPIGMLRARPVTLAMELGWQADAMSDAIAEVSKMGMCMVDEKAGLMVAPNFLKYNPPNGPNSLASWGDIVDLMPECELRSRALLLVKSFIDGLSEGMRKGIPQTLTDAIEDAIKDVGDKASNIQEQEQEQEQIEVGDFALTAPSQDDQLFGKTEQLKKPKAQPKPITFEFNLTALPDAWRKYCNDTRPDLNPDLTFQDFRFYWTQGRGKGTRKSEKGWAQTWQNWVRREKESRTKPAFRQTTNYEEIDYDEGINPDGTF